LADTARRARFFNGLSDKDVGRCFWLLGAWMAVLIMT
jgi:hypothetical protein